MAYDEIAPAPVKSFDDLIAKTGLILEATKQSMVDCDEELELAILRRVKELRSDFDGIDCVPEQIAVFGMMLEEIREVIRQSDIAELNEKYSTS